MVTILSVAFTSLTRMEQERCTSPLTCTAQAPHWAMPQPYLVPVRPACSRKAQSRGVLPSTFKSTVFPFTLSLATFFLLLESARGPARREPSSCFGRLRSGYGKIAVSGRAYRSHLRARSFCIDVTYGCRSWAPIVQCNWGARCAREGCIVRAFGHGALRRRPARVTLG